MRWRRNLFNLPTGKAGEDFIDELTKLYCHFNDSTAFESIALTLSAIIFPLLLQKPAPTSKSRDHVKYLQKRLLLWRAGNLKELLSEGRAIQNRFSKKKKKSRQSKQQSRFISLMEQGKVSAALRCIGSQETSVLDVTPEVLNELKDKHPEAKTAASESLYQGPVPQKVVEAVIFENIDANAIHKAAKKVNGAAGPSGGDASLWHRLLCSKQFKKKPADLCQALAVLSRKLNTETISPQHLRGFVAGRLIPLDKQPGVRPIGIGEIPRRIVSSATVSLLNPGLVAATAPLQTCAGLPGGIEASIHAMRRIFNDEETEAILLVDARNAFNAMNRQAALHNIQYSCPELSTFLHNIYGCQAELFLPNSDETILSEEGTTQGGPESMGFYATSMIPLSTKSAGVKKLFYADDGSGGAKLDCLKVWWDSLKREGPPLGYFPYPLKSWLITKPAHLLRAQELFPDVNITTDGHEFLGSFIGNEEATKEFIDGKVLEWSKDIDALTDIARSEPQLAYSAYIFGTARRWQFVCRTTPGISEHLRELEERIREKLIPAIMGGRQPSDDMRLIYSLPARMGGLGFQDPSAEASTDYECSMRITAQLANAIYDQDEQFEPNDDQQTVARKEVAELKEARQKALLESVKNNCSEAMARLIDLSSEKGASGWLTSLPLIDYGFRLNKQQFVDALCMRYDLAISDTPRTCVCGQAYSMNHCLTCKNGGYINIRHDTVRDTTHTLLDEVCGDVRIEPGLLPVTGEQLNPGANDSDGARADVSALGFWLPMSRAFFDVKVINPLAQTNWKMKIPAMYKHHELIKKRGYNARILQVEKGTFTPLVFSCTGGMAPEAERFVKELALKISLKRGEAYSQTVHFIRRRIRFEILRSCVISLRGERKNPTRRVPDIREVDIGLCHLIDR